MSVLILRSSIPTPSGPTPIFADDFSSYSVGVSIADIVPPVAAAGCTWDNVDGSQGGSSVKVQNDGLGGKCLEFNYRQGDRWAEMRGILDPTGQKQYSNLWFNFDLFIPSGWTHYGTNNKFLIVYNDNTGGTAFNDCEFWPYDVDPVLNPNEYTGSFCQMQLKRNGSNLGFEGGVATNGNAHGELYQFINDQVDKGTWINWRFHMYLGTNTSNGLYRIWKNGSVITEKVNFNNFNSGTNGFGYSNNHFSGFYLLGFHNVTQTPGGANGYPVQTNYLLKDFRVYAQDPGWGG